MSAEVSLINITRKSYVWPDRKLSSSEIHFATRNIWLSNNDFNSRLSFNNLFYRRRGLRWVQPLQNNFIFSHLLFNKIQECSLAKKYILAMQAFERRVKLHLNFWSLAGLFLSHKTFSSFSMIHSSCGPSIF